MVVAEGHREDIDQKWLVMIRLTAVKALYALYGSFLINTTHPKRTITAKDSYFINFIVRF